MNPRERVFDPSPTGKPRRLTEEEPLMSNKTKRLLVKTAVYTTVLTAAVLLVREPLNDLTGRKWG